MLQFIKRIKQLLHRRSRAKKLGISFNRMADFQMPDAIWINGQKKSIHYPSQDPSSSIVFIENLLDDCYHIERISHPIKTALDIGGNLGFSSLKIKMEYPQAIIHCYEPNQDNEMYLKAQALAGGFTYFMEALGKKAGMVELISEKKESQEVLALAHTVISPSGKIVQTSISTAIERLGGKVDFVKMDCEGAEWDILQDYQAWLNVKSLSLEYHLDPENGRTYEGIKQVLLNLHYYILYHKSLEDNTGLLICTRP
jgi:FkbM family methyltransferase